METNKIYWKDAAELLTKGSKLSGWEIEFKDERIDFKTAALFNRNGIRVDETLIEYQDDEIDFSDDPDLSEEDVENNKLVWTVKANLSVDKELKDWIEKEQIDIDRLLLKLMRGFYETMRDLPNKAAF